MGKFTSLFKDPSYDQNQNTLSLVLRFIIVFSVVSWTRGRDAAENRTGNSSLIKDVHATE